jgi:hypothetical protein
MITPLRLIFMSLPALIASCRQDAGYRLHQQGRSAMTTIGSLSGQPAPVTD